MSDEAPRPPLELCALAAAGLAGFTAGMQSPGVALLFTVVALFLHGLGRAIESDGS